MDRAQLQQMLAEGLSLAEIGRRVGVHESTVGYWVGKHGFRATHQGRHAARGRIARAELERLVEAGLSAGEIGLRLDRSKTTVRHWLREYGLQTQWTRRRLVSQAGIPRVELLCRRHGLTEFSLRGSGGYRCNKCRAEAVATRRRKVKLTLVQEAGGACVECGYDRCVAALHFHHVEPTEKAFSLSHRGVTRSIARARAEASKCVLLCSNCHAEVEAGLVTLRGQDSARVQ